VTASGSWLLAPGSLLEEHKIHASNHRGPGLIGCGLCSEAQEPGTRSVTIEVEQSAARNDVAVHPARLG